MDPQVFRLVIGNFASGVRVLTTREHDTNYGLTASAVTSLTLEPLPAAGLYQQEYCNTSGD